MTRDEADTIALQALAFILAEEERADRFLAISGMDREELVRAARAGEPGLMGGVLDFLLDWEPDLADFCEMAGLAPEAPLRARRTLPGATPEW